MMIPPDEDPYQLRRDMEIEEMEEAWQDLFERAMEGIDALRNIPIRELSTAEILVLVYRTIRDEQGDAAWLVYEAWKRVATEDP